MAPSRSLKPAEAAPAGGPLPDLLQPFFWDYEFQDLSWEQDRDLIIRRCLEAGFQVATHAIGDAANHFVLNAYERALKETHASGARLRIEHAQALAPPDIPRFVKLGVIASMQPSHCTSDMVSAETRLGPGTDDRTARHLAELR